MTGKQIDHLVKMANQIAINLGAQRDPDEAARLIGEHLGKFWTGDMRRQLARHAQAHAEQLSGAVLKALADEEPGEY